MGSHNSEIMCPFNVITNHNIILGDLEGAASIINELHVETYGTMDRKEKVEFILEQMRLTIANKDMVRAQIISKVCIRQLYRIVYTYI